MTVSNIILSKIDYQVKDSPLPGIGLNADIAQRNAVDKPSGGKVLCVRTVSCRLFQKNKDGSQRDNIAISLVYWIWFDIREENVPSIDEIGRKAAESTYLLVWDEINYLLNKAGFPRIPLS